MFRIVKVIIWIILILFISPILKDWYDVYTNSTNGLMIGVVDDTVLAIFTFIPWYVPMVLALGILLYLVRPEPIEPPSYPQFRMPPQAKPPKRRPPMM